MERQHWRAQRPAQGPFVVVPLTQIQGERTDAVAQVKFDSSASWSAYGFGQHTVAASGGREDNSRIGLGGSYRLTKRFRIDGKPLTDTSDPVERSALAFSIPSGPVITELFAGKRADRQRAAASRQPGQPGLGREDAALRHFSVYVEERYQNGAS